jgi:TolB-like protein/class 3 adenylate cyclase/Tfp pilus assembly protein PilF
MTEGRKLAAILAADVVGYSRLAGADEERTLARLRALRGDLIDPAIAAHRGRIVKRTGDGTLVEFRSVVDAVRCALEVQAGMKERNAGVTPERQIQFRIGIHLGDVVEESDGDLMGDGVNIAARLEGIAEPGEIFLSNAAYEQVRDKIDAAFADLGEKELKNIARPVRVFAFSAAAAPHRATLRVASPPPAGGGRLGGRLAAEQSPPRLSIVVLPFANIGGDPEQEYFVDGVTESLTTDLSRIGGSFVIARNTAFTYKGKSVDVKQISRDLNVRYVLEGSVQRGGNRLRVNVQLIDAESGNHLWAERFDKPLADLFDMQDEIVTRLARALDIELTAAEARRGAQASNPDAMDLVFRANALINLGEDAQTYAETRALYRRALDLEPDNVEALVGWAYVTAVAAGASFMTEDRAADLAAAEQAAVGAIELAPNHARAHMVLGMTYYWSDRAAKSVPEIERAIALDRNLTLALAALAVAMVYDGKAELAEGHIIEAFRLSPSDALGYIWCFVAGHAMFYLGRDEEAIRWFRRGLELNRRHVTNRFFLAAALALLGQTGDAADEMRAGLALNPRVTIRRLREMSPSNHPVYLTQRERFYDGVRKAGMPEE